MQKIILTESQLKRLIENEKMEENYMFFQNLDQIERQCKLLRQIDPSTIDQLLSQGHDWADDHMTEAKSLMDQVFDFIMNETKGHQADEEPVSADMNQFSMNEGKKKMKNPCWKGYRAYGTKEKDGKQVPNCVPIDESTIIEEDEFGIVQSTDFIADDILNEAEYQGRKVQLGKPFLTPNGPKKRSVYVKNDKGNVVKVNFGDPNMRIKKNIPSHRKSFRARHHCENPGPRWKARYWSCKAW
jgi:hypothetical protein